MLVRHFGRLVRHLGRLLRRFGMSVRLFWVVLRLFGMSVRLFWRSVRHLGRLLRHFGLVLLSCDLLPLPRDFSLSQFKTAKKRRPHTGGRLFLCRMMQSLCHMLYFRHGADVHIATTDDNS